MLATCRQMSGTPQTLAVCKTQTLAVCRCQNPANSLGMLPDQVVRDCACFCWVLQTRPCLCRKLVLCFCAFFLLSSTYFLLTPCWSLRDSQPRHSLRDAVANSQDEAQLLVGSDTALIIVCKYHVSEYMRTLILVLLQLMQ